MRDDKWPEFECRYFHEGSWWGLTICARDWKDAEARVAKLGNLQLMGEVMARIPAQVPGAGLLARSIVAARNLFAAK